MVVIVIKIFASSPWVPLVISLSLTVLRVHLLFLLLCYILLRACSVLREASLLLKDDSQG